MGDFPIYRSRRKAKRDIREYGLSSDGVAKIHMMGMGHEGPKSSNIIKRADKLEKVGFLFPRRNLVIRADVLAEGIMSSGSREGWGTKSLRQDELSKIAFWQWSNRVIWPVVEKIFEGRAVYVRSDAPGDSLGRGVYESVPFANREGHPDSETRSRIFSNVLLRVIRSYFSDTAEAFRNAQRVVNEGMNVFISQFVGQPTTHPGTNRRALLPFISAVVKSTLFAKSPGKGLVRFEYGMGKGALSGRSIITNRGVAKETIVGKNRKPGVYCSWVGTKVTGFDTVYSTEIQLDDTKWAVLNSMLAEPYPLSGNNIETNGKQLLGWLVGNLPRIERENGGPIYLELVSSSFRQRLRWFVVQVADYPPMHQIPEPPKDTQFISNSDFYGHGEVEGRKKVLVFTRESFKEREIMEKLERINRANKDFVVVLPQEALTGTNLTDLSGSHFSNACAVLEYQMLGQELWRGSVHQGPSHEHFEQLARDLNTLFIPVERLTLVGIEPSEKGVTSFEADVHLACDKERQIAWGSLRNIRRSTGKPPPAHS